MEWEALLERERSRYEDGRRRLDPEQLVRVGNAAYGAGLALLMLGRADEAGLWLDRAADSWRESWAHATPTSWGRPIGAIKAKVIAGRDEDARELARWALSLGSATAESPIGRYAACLARLVLGEWAEAARLAETLRSRDDFPPAVADSLAAIGRADEASYAQAIESVLVSFETRDEYLEDAAVADTALALEALAASRGVATGLRPSQVLPA